MAQNATIFKADVSISDMDRNYYAQHNLTLARHPSETDERMMLRLIAFIQNAKEQLVFTKGLSEDEEPDLWQKTYTEEIELWIELGQPSEQRIKKGCNQSQVMQVFNFENNAFITWWQKEGNKLKQRNNLQVFTVEDAFAAKLAAVTQRNMQIQVTIQDGEMWLTFAEDILCIKTTQWM